LKNTQESLKKLAVTQKVTANMIAYDEQHMRIFSLLKALL
jgi:hypothetical protein